MIGNLTEDQLKESLAGHGWKVASALRGLGLSCSGHNKRVMRRIRDQFFTPSDHVVFDNKIKEINRHKRFVISCAINDCDYDKKFLDSLKGYCSYNRSLLLLQPLKYRNPSSPFEMNSSSNFPKELSTYYVNTKVKFNKNVYFIGDVNVQATSVNPIASLNSCVPYNASSIVAHPQIQLRMRSSPKDIFPRLITTTGTISKNLFLNSKNRTSVSKLDYLAQKNHSTGALVLEILKNKFFIRHVVAEKDGSFYDLDKKYLPNGNVVKGVRASGLVCGDLHTRFIDSSVLKSTFTNTDSIVNVLKPKNLIIHDFFDSNSISHHDEGKRLTQYKKYITKDNILLNELNDSVSFHNRYFNLKDTRIVYVPSNHNDHLHRWLQNGFPDVFNLRAFCLLNLQILDEIDNDGKLQKEPFFIYLKNNIKTENDVIFLSRDSSYLISGVDVSQHGDIGPNGVRGSIRSFTAIDRPMVIGHSHIPAIDKGVYQVGTSCKLTLPYNAGTSGWMHCHCVIYPSGKRSLLFVVKGDWFLKGH